MASPIRCSRRRPPPRGAACPIRTILPSRAVVPGRIRPALKSPEFGDPGWIRTSDPQLRRLVLYPAELRGLAWRNVYPRRGPIERCALGFGRLTCTARGPTMSVIAELTCADLTSAYRRGAFSPVEVARDCLARIAANAAINAFLPIEPAAVFAASAESDARWRAGKPLGPIDGVPATIKDNIWAKGLPTRRGSKTSDPATAQADSPAVARMREQGAVVLGKTCMPEHGWIGVCHSPLTGITRNPWNLEHTPGGSTGGGAVAALLGLGVLHLGTDGAGSLRIPGAFTGVFGIKPSFGLVPIYPALLLNVLSHQGPITRTVADAALMLSVIAQPDARDMAAWNTPAPDFSAGLDDGVHGLRVALSMRLGHVEALNPEIEAGGGKGGRVFQEQGAL